MGKRRYNLLVLMWSILLFTVIIRIPITAFARERTSSGTEAVTETEALTEALSEKEQADRVAEEMYHQAELEEPAVTGLLKSVESDQAYLEGLEYRLKTVSSLSRKLLLTAHENGVTLDEARADIGDALRYTLIIDDSVYTEKTKETLDFLKDAGYQVTKFKNYWANDERAYQGINCNLSCPNGMVFELQFHTQDSYETKGEKTHKYYEIMRDENASDEEKEEARKKHDALFALIPVPDGARDMTYPEYQPEKTKGQVQ